MGFKTASALYLGCFATEGLKGLSAHHKRVNGQHNTVAGNRMPTSYGLSEPAIQRYHYHSSELLLLPSALSLSKRKHSK
jgi:hypothetical protein